MYRVELKDLLIRRGLHWEKHVPNVPCGVERHSDCGGRVMSEVFLMYRVELKVLLCKVIEVFGKGS